VSFWLLSPKIQANLRRFSLSDSPKRKWSCLAFALAAVCGVGALGATLFFLVIRNSVLPNVEYVAFHPSDPHRLLTVRDDALVFWDISGGTRPKLEWKFEGAASPRSPSAAATSRQNTMPKQTAVYSPDGTVVATGTNDGKVWLLWKAGEPVRSLGLALHSSAITSLAFSADGTQLISGDEAGNITIWNGTDWEEQKMLPPQSGRVNALAYSPNGELFVSAAGNPESKDYAIAIWGRDGSLVAHVENDAGFVPLSIAFAPSGTFFAVGHRGGVSLINADGSVRARMLSESKGEYPVAISNDGRFMACGIRGQGYELWEFDANGNAVKLGTYGSASYHLGFLPDNKTIVSADSRLYIQNLEGQDIVKPIFAHGDWIRSMSIASDGSLIATVGEHGSFCVWKRDGTKYAEFR
jgi:WD40 repeat protein